MRPNAPVLLHTFIVLLSSHIFPSTCQCVGNCLVKRDLPSHGYNDVGRPDWGEDNNNATAYRASLSTERFSTPEDCARDCQDGQAPRWCYYKFRLERYTTMSRACELCTPNNLDQISNTPQCQCIQADGFERGMLSINRMLPGPSIQVCKNDRIVVDVENDISGMEVTLHWHGIWQQGSQYYDGVPALTQCPINSDTTFRYQFIAGNAGTHFYHSHSGAHKMDGQYGSLIVRQAPSADPHTRLYDEDLLTHVILISDWMHEMSIQKFPGRYSRDRGQMPVSLLINGKGRWKDPTTNITTTSQLESFTVEAGKRYRFRLINSMSSTCSSQLAIEGHSLILIAQDGESVQPTPVDTINTYSGERVDFILNANSSVGAYWIQLRSPDVCRKANLNQLAVLKYRGGSKLPKTPEPGYNTGLKLGILYNPPKEVCDMDRSSTVCAHQLKSVEKVSMELLKDQPDHRIILPFKFYSYSVTNTIPTLFRSGTYSRFVVAADGDHIGGMVDNISHKFPSGPPLSQPVYAADTCDRNRLPENCSEPCACLHTHHIKMGAVVEVMIYDSSFKSVLSHPFHLHGYAFKLFKIGLFADTKNITKQDISGILKDHQKMLEYARYRRPPGKDTITVPHAGYVIFRFKADNPGWWLFHCHFLSHELIGMNVVFHIGEQSDLPPVPPMFPTCGNFQPDPLIN